MAKGRGKTSRVPNKFPLILIKLIDLFFFVPVLGILNAIFPQKCCLLQAKVLNPVKCLLSFQVDEKLK